jgi:hypothetical protein
MITTRTIGESARLAKRRQNKKLAGLAGSPQGARAGGDEPIALACECRSARCTARVWLDTALFHSAVDGSEFSLVVPGHAWADEHVVAASAGYQFVVPLNHVSKLEPATIG